MTLFGVRPLRPALLVIFAAALSACSAAGQQTSPAVSGGLGADSNGSAHAAVTTKSWVGGGSPMAASRPKSVFGPWKKASPDGFASRPDASSAVVYDSIVTNSKNQLSSYIASEGFECCSTDEFGDSLVLTQGGRLKQIEVVMDSWGCESGDGYHYATCQTTKNAKFTWPITANVYGLTGYPNGVPTVGTLLASHTQTFAIPYRPSSNTKFCQGQNYGAFVGPVDKECDFGIAAPITFNMSLPATTIPDQVIVTVAFNTSDSGYNPVGHNTTCFQQGDCPYDSLNVSAWGNGGIDDNIGSAADPNGVMVNFTNTGFYCPNNPNSPPGSTLVDDTPCWTGYHPEIKVTTY
jgi:hypothetical protein